jgi:hypothetical protein
LFGGSGPDVDEKNLAPLGKAVKDGGGWSGYGWDTDQFGM